MYAIRALGRDSDLQDRTKAQHNNAVAQLAEYGADQAIDHAAIMQSERAWQINRRFCVRIGH